MTSSAQSNSATARQLAEEIVRRDDTTLVEALLANAIDLLAGEIDALRDQLAANRPDPRSAFIGG